MFYRCTSLTKAPELPATTLAESCYNRMFYRCTSLTKAPELPATNLAKSCYSEMFCGCSNLNYIKMLATDLTTFDYPYYCFSSWLDGTAAAGTFVKNSAANEDEGDSPIPYGWTVIYYNTDSNKYYLDKECTKECDDHGNSL